MEKVERASGSAGVLKGCAGDNDFSIWTKGKVGLENTVRETVKSL